LSSFFAFFTAFFSFFACFRSPFVILDIRCAPPVEGQRWASQRTSQVPSYAGSGAPIACLPVTQRSPRIRYFEPGVPRTAPSN
jgi:hypothetical protein